MTRGSSMLAMISSLLPQRVQPSISMPKRSRGPARQGHPRLAEALRMRTSNEALRMNVAKVSLPAAPR